MSFANHSTSIQEVSKFDVERVTVHVLETPLEVGRCAASGVERSICDRVRSFGSANVVFAAAPSQNELLHCIVSHSNVPWQNVNMFHMDEYLGIARSRTESFRHYLDEHLLRYVAVKSMNLIDADADCVPSICPSYEALLRESPPDVVCAGIGENGHLAFNDPAVADFGDPLWVKIVRLDSVCREQQVQDGCFRNVYDVPAHAVTLTIPALLQAKRISVVVVGERKKRAVRDALLGPVGESCPASILRRVSGVDLYLDRASAALVL